MIMNVITTNILEYKYLLYKYKHVPPNLIMLRYCRANYHKYAHFEQNITLGTVRRAIDHSTKHSNTYDLRS